MRSFRKLVTLLLIILVVLGLYATNPSKSEFIDWAKEQASANTDSVLEKGLVALVGNFMIDSYTTTKNCLLFSIYTVSTGDSHVTVVGILNNFIVASGDF